MSQENLDLSKKLVKLLQEGFSVAKDAFNNFSK